MARLSQYKMARMYSRKKGKSGSNLIVTDKVREWVKYNSEETIKLILKFAKAGKQCSEIGMILRDQYGIPSVKEVCKKTINKILKENKITPELPDALANLIKREVMILKHLEKNHKDQTAKRGLNLTESKIRRLAKYYKKTGVLPKDWKYNKEQAKLMIG
jgi:small subunit ribosomal protein S15